jgi:hypothetical protein
MQYVLYGGAALVGLLVIYQYLRKAKARQLARWLRWAVGGGLAALSAFLLLRGQIGLVTLTGPVAFMILRYGRIGNFSFESSTISEDNESAVRTRFISMKLDHDTGEVEGRVIAGRFKGRDLKSLDESEMRRLLDEVGADPDGLALLETWLDKHRSGWREHFDGTSQTSEGPEEPSAHDPEAEALEILGLKRGASEDEIRAAHRKLIMGVHPDQGGSAYLAARINAAKDRLLKKSRK